MRQIQNSRRTVRFLFTVVLVGVALSQMPSARVSAQTAKWIWNPDQKQGEVPQGDCYFRKKFKVERPRQVLLKVAANDRYEVHINNQVAAVGETTEIKTFDVGSAIKAGTNTIAVKVTNSKGNTAGFAAAIVIQKPDNQWRIIATDNTWKTSTKAISIWRASVYNDSKWKLAYILGADKSQAKKTRPDSGKTTDVKAAPQRTTATKTKTKTAATKMVISDEDPKSESKPASSSESEKKKPDTVESPTVTEKKQNAGTNDSTEQPSVSKTPPVTEKPQVLKPVAVRKPEKKPVNDSSRPVISRKGSRESAYKIQDEFEVRRILGGKHGSYIAMAFNEFGQTIVSCEGKGLIRVDFTRKAAGPNERVTIVCKSVRNIQGILPINGKLFVTGDGPEGIALYELSDRDKDGFYETSRSILKFKGKPGEHGPHGLCLGPDGMIYIVFGNQSGIDASMIAKSSPYQAAYEGESIKRYEDPGGHALGVKAPGGMVIRLNLDGSKVEAVAGGIRNAYDLVFNAYGDLFIHDSDMEADLGLPWYRDTQLFHVIAGAEIGWRRGWAKWPDYYIDGSKPVAKTGAGSPTGATSYQHVMFPIRYHNALFLGDWLNGRIISAQLRPDGATYKAVTETFFEANGMTITDLSVGPDGALYFCTGGRGTEGGIYRIHWTGNVPEAFRNLKNDMAKIVRSPQPMSPWTMQQKALLRIKMKSRWSQSLRGIVNETANKPVYRQNAINAMLLYGPRPSVDEVIEWTRDPSSTVRRAATQLLASLKDSRKSGASREKTKSALVRLVGDEDTFVRRTACETMVRLEMKCEPQVLEPMLRSGDWSQATAARRLLETIDVDKWYEMFQTTKDPGLFCQLSASLIKVQPTLKNAYQILVRHSELSEAHVSDEDFINMLRVSQLAIAQAKVDPMKIPAFTQRISNEFPAQNGKINRELAHLLAHLKSAHIEDRLTKYFKTTSDSMTDQIAVAMYFQTISDKLSSRNRLAIVDFLETQKDRQQTGSSYRHYLEQAIRDMSASIREDEFDTVLENGDRWQNATLALFYRIGDLTSKRVEKIIEIDQETCQTHGFSQCQTQTCDDCSPFRLQ